MRSTDYPEGKIMDSLLAEITKLQSENKELREVIILVVDRMKANDFDNQKWNIMEAAIQKILSTEQNQKP